MRASLVLLLCYQFRSTNFHFYYIKFSNIRVLKSAVIYGANGSGKSNFIDAIAFVKDLVMYSINNQQLRTMPH